MGGEGRAAAGTSKLEAECIRKRSGISSYSEDATVTPGRVLNAFDLLAAEAWMPNRKSGAEVAATLPPEGYKYPFR